MARALRLAEKGLYTTDPNPRVGCLIVKDERIIGEGWHLRAGEPHAEIHALRQAGGLARGSEVFVTLEPCAHFGRTPPCADALIAAGVRRVSVAALDPNPLVAGKGMERMRQAGIEVACGLLEREAEALNVGFFHRMRTGRPWVRVKTAASLDGRVALANGESRWITSEAARQDVQRLRARSSAILTGVNTVLADDPEFSVRGDAISMASAGLIRQPLRIVLDSQLRLTPELKIFASSASRPLIVTTRQAATARPAELQMLAERAEVLIMPGAIDLYALLKMLGERGCNELLVEAGGKVAGAFLAQSLCEEYWLYIATRLLGDAAIPMAVLPQFTSLAAVPQFSLKDSRQIGEDLRLVLVPKRSC
jgi:diaminohydroxyphosphoribosylaminopyrimidine deaminase/5-amino-6-(5-phosphoribosylamino)uracil reductase